MRPARNGAVPPACDQMYWMSGKRVEVPLNMTPRMARVVSVPYSMMPGGTSGMRFLQQLAAVGWTWTTALRRLSLPSPE